jgi:AcrR family transcriptional regulator
MVFQWGFEWNSKFSLMIPAELTILLLDIYFNIHYIIIRPTGRSNNGGLMSIDTRNNILAAANRLFLKQGYTAASMRQIAELAGIGKATIYHHFADKEAIVTALLEQNTARMNEVLERVRQETRPRERIQVATEASIDFLYRFADIIQIVRREVPGVRTQSQNGFSQFFQEYINLMAEAIQTGSEQGIFRSVDPNQAARVLMSMIQGTFAMTFLTNERVLSQQQTIRSILDVYFNGIDQK